MLPSLCPHPVLPKGCWESSGKCSQSQCVLEGPPSKARNNTKFCCCAGDMCNVNVKDNENPPTTGALDTNSTIPGRDLLNVEQMRYGTETMMITITLAVTLLLIAAIIMLAYRRWLNVHKPSSDSVHLMESSPPPPSPTLDLDNLKLIELVGRGRYGCVWRGTLDEKEVAAKVFPHQHRQYYLNEKDIYGLAFMDHPSITKFIGADEKTDPCGIPSEYLIVMAHAPCGCLQDYLRRNTIDWSTLCRMTSSVAKGVAHLHTDIRKGNKVKPCISHRDINSRNVLVKGDLSCALCDMGFAMKIAGSKYYGQNGEEQHAETTSLTDVGTLRYMAPEVLEGAVNLRDCESSLKQIDVYAMGLVLWEVASRCADLYQGTEVNEYKLPFQNEIGLHPTFEQMQVLVSRHKARPLFPEVWKDTNLAIRLLKETIEDCWDQDAEARLTSLCVEERLHELPNLWERHKATSLGVSGVSPTVNSTTIYNHNQQQQLQPTLNGQQQSQSLLHMLTLPGAGNHGVSDNEMTDRNANIVVSLGDVLPRITHNNRSSALGTSCKSSNNTNESSVSEQTAETFLTLSPSSDLSLDNGNAAPPSPSPSPPPLPPILTQQKLGLNKKGVNNNYHPHRHRLNQTLQPHQGRNPCLERNMIMEPLEEITVSGNRLLDKRFNHDNKSPLRVRRELSPEHMGGLFDALNIVDSGSESNALVTNDVLGQTAANRSSVLCHPPIPYVQNAVHSTMPVCPKQPNVPGNGHSHCQPLPSSSFTNNNNNMQSSKVPKKGAFVGRFECKRWQSSVNPAAGGSKKVKDWSSFRSLLFDWAKLTNNDSPTNVSNDNRPEINSVKLRCSAAVDALNTEKSNLLSHRNVSSNFVHHLKSPAAVTKVQTRVCLTSNTEQSPNTVTLVTNGDGGGTNLNENSNNNITSSSISSSSSSPEVGVARLHVPNGPTPIHVVQSRSRPSPNPPPPPPPPSSFSSFASCASPVNKSHRPNSLPLKDPHQQPPSVDVPPPVTRGSGAKIEKRVKTPFKLKTNRLSLCDDRMMSSEGSAVFCPTNGSSSSSSSGSSSNENAGSSNGCKYSSSVPGNICSASYINDFLSSRDKQQCLAPPLLPLPSTSQSSAANGSIYQVSCI